MYKRDRPSRRRLTETLPTFHSNTTRKRYRPCCKRRKDSSQAHLYRLAMCLHCGNSLVGPMVHQDRKLPRACSWLVHQRLRFALPSPIERWWATACRETQHMPQLHTRTHRLPDSFPDPPENSHWTNSVVRVIQSDL